MRQKPKFKRTFSLRWRGRRWYDPNERKVALTTLPVGLLAGLLRLVVFSVTSGQTVVVDARQPPPHGIFGTAHDLSAKGLNHVTNSQEVCIFCHTPHSAPGDINQAIPVWNHETTVAQFTLYTSTSLKGAVDAQPLGPSLACLSCHDGTLAVGALHEVPLGGGHEDYAQAAGGVNRGTGMIEGPNQMGRDLTSVHPISVTYRDDLSPTLRPAGELVGVKLYPSNVRGAKVQCASCHDPHNFGIEGSTAPFLRVSKQGSALCLACHRV